MVEVVTTGEARDALHRIAQRFDAGDGEPVYFGSHRRAQAVIVPVEVWERLLEQAKDGLDVALATDRVADDDVSYPPCPEDFAYPDCEDRRDR